MNISTKRFFEIDALRTCAILLMVIYHTAFDLQFYYQWNIDIHSGLWWIIGRSSATLFLLLIGASFIVATRYKLPHEIWKRSLKKGGALLAIAAAISIVTYVIDANTYIRFGILHCIGVSILLMPLFLRFKEWNVCIGILFTLIGMQQKTMTGGNSALILLGISYKGFQTLDYFPLLPWFGIILIGMGIGYLIYIDCRRQPKPISSTWNMLTAPGKHSLILYLIHQPIILGILYLLYTT